MATSGLTATAREQAFCLFLVDERGEARAKGRVLGRIIKDHGVPVFNCKDTRLYENYQAFGVWPELALRILPELHVQSYEIEHKERRYILPLATLLEKASRGEAVFDLDDGGEVDVPMLYVALQALHHWNVGTPRPTRRFIPKETRLTYVIAAPKQAAIATAPMGLQQHGLGF